MNSSAKQSIKVPLTSPPKILYLCTLIVASLLLAASLVGILDRNTTYPTDELLQAFLPTDVSVLLIGLPMILGSLWLTRRGKLVGLLLWPGALFFVVYNYLVYILAMPLNVAFLAHVTLVALSGYTLIALLASIDTQAIGEKLSARVPVRLTGGILTGFGLLFVLRAILMMVTSLVNQEPITSTEVALNTTDFIISPAWVVCGVLLWRRQDFGFVTGLGMLFQASMLFIGLIINLILLPLITNAAFNMVDVVVVFAMGFICFIPFFLYLRGVQSAEVA